jgi:hypothetical protein
MAKTLTMRLDDEAYETFARAAQAERRSLANLVERRRCGKSRRAALWMTRRWRKSSPGLGS